MNVLLGIGLHYCRKEKEQFVQKKTLFPLIVRSFKTHLGKVTFISEHSFRSGLNCAWCFKWHTKEEHTLWDWLWLRNICPFPKQSIVPLLPCHCPSPSLSKSLSFPAKELFLEHRESTCKKKKKNRESILIWKDWGTSKTGEWCRRLNNTPVCLFTFSMGYKVNGDFKPDFCEGYQV